ncbi:DUF3325 domain-containing protein [Sphingobium aromaticiconvertens]|uniref:DUF3325 domain-containing protein n=1 Tax=Sphingobium aromaticiconvertens TaxID=365341 RepID=UPI00301919D2
MIHILAMTLCVTGFACLCAAMARHQKDFIGHKLETGASRQLRLIGGTILLLALSIDMAGLGAGYGAIAWCGHLTVAAALVLTHLNWAIARNITKTRTRD